MKRKKRLELKRKYLAVILSLMVIITLGSSVSYAEEDVEAEGLVWLIDLENERMLDMDKEDLIAGDKIMIYSAYDRISITYRDLSDSENVYEKIENSYKDQFILQNRAPAELIIEHEGEVLFQGVIREDSIVNNIRYTYGIERYDLVYTMLMAFSICLIGNLITFLKYEVRLI